MSAIATRGNKVSNVLVYEQFPEFGHCRSTDTVVVESGMDVGAVVVSAVVSGTATAVTTGTGNGVMGTITVADTAKIGVYTLQITKAVNDAGDFAVYNPQGVLVGIGAVGTAFSGGGLSFTLADGSANFIVGDTIAITVAGTQKYKWVEAADVATLVDDVRVVIDQNTYTSTAGSVTLNTLHRGAAGVANAGLKYKDTLSAGQKAIVYAKLEAKGIKVLTQV